MSVRPPSPAPGLYVVARPAMAAADEARLRDLRARYHAAEAGMIGPHFTLVFARPAESHDLLVNHVEGVTSGMAAIDFVLRRTVLHVDPGVAYAFLEPQEGRQELLDLHRALNAGAPAADPATDPGAAPAWTPHITIGRSASAPEMRAVLQELRREEVAIAGRIATLTLIDVGLGRIRELGEWGLKKD